MSYCFHLVVLLWKRLQYIKKLVELNGFGRSTTVISTLIQTRCHWKELSERNLILVRAVSFVYKRGFSSYFCLSFFQNKFDF